MVAQSCLVFESHPCSIQAPVHRSDIDCFPAVFFVTRVVCTPKNNATTCFPVVCISARRERSGGGDDGGNGGGGGGGSSGLLGGSGEQTEFAFRLHLYKAKVLLLQEQVRLGRKSCP